ncbi:helix-turn-helix transcriptional regulator [Streptomyces sp. NBC_01361]|uniref:helix-turn-helix transcriptional regulator n=1 Tax=Streptomyces sp. NBC_01361 TaxID=2903838 RepID=UPI002E32757F|nr:LuxR C-terminal-related transcriptional regulator [Streptomyces sp. NBC_01361]
MSAAYEPALVAILSTVRSKTLDDNRARLEAADVASAALIALRSVSKSDRSLSEEAAPAAFTKLRKEIWHTLRFHEAQTEFVAPSDTDRPLPGEIAYAARAMTHAATLAFTAQPGLTRLRIAWTCDATSLRIEIRDQHSGDLDVASLRRQLQGRARTLGATIDLEAVSGWGSRATITLPFDVPSDPSGESRLTRLNRREQQVLHLVAQGKRNKAIAEALGIAESTVKFHIAGMLRNLEVTSRGEATAFALKAGITAPEDMKPR